MIRSLLILLVISSFSVQAQEFYVSTAGNDGASGTSVETAWESLQHAMDNASPGSVVYILGGIYNEKCYMNVDGNEGLWIEFRNYNDDEVIIDGTGLTDSAILEMYDSNYIRLRGIHFKNNIQLDAIGILIDGLSSNIGIIDCKVSQVHFSSNPDAEVTELTNSQPIIVYGSEDTPITQLKFEGNEVYDCRTGYSEAFAVNGNVDGFEVIGNSVHDISNIGIDIIGHEGTCGLPELDQARNGIIQGNVCYNCISPYASAAGIYVDGAKDLIIERNKVYSNQWGVEIGCENVGKTTSNVELRNNFIYSNSSAGLAIGGYDYPNGSGAVLNCTVRHNSFFNNDTASEFTGEMAISYVEQVDIYNNIFYANNIGNVLFYLDDAVPNPVDLSLNNNLWYAEAGVNDVEVSFHGTEYSSFSDYQAGANQDLNSIFSNPSFANINPGEEDLHLQANSAAIEMGIEDFVASVDESDIDGQSRVVGVVDMGADEFSGTNGISISKMSRFLVYPNPACDLLNLAFNKQSIAYLYDANGRIILAFDVYPGTQAMDITGVDSGMYILRVDEYTSRLFVQ
jgi:hypothetical protein